MNPIGMKILVIGSNGNWAKADMLEDALKSAFQPKYYFAYIVHPESTVSDLGAIVYPTGYAPKLIARKLDRKILAKMKKIEAPLPTKRTPYADTRSCEPTGEVTLPEEPVRRRRSRFDPAPGESL